LVGWGGTIGGTIVIGEREEWAGVALLESGARLLYNLQICFIGALLCLSFWIINTQSLVQGGVDGVLLNGSADGGENLQKLKNDSPRPNASTNEWVPCLIGSAAICIGQ